MLLLLLAGVVLRLWEEGKLRMEVGIAGGGVMYVCTHITHPVTTPYTTHTTHKPQSRTQTSRQGKSSIVEARHTHHTHTHTNHTHTQLHHRGYPRGPTMTHSFEALVGPARAHVHALRKYLRPFPTTQPLYTTHTHTHTHTTHTRNKDTAFPVKGSRRLW